MLSKRWWAAMLAVAAFGAAPVFADDDEEADEVEATESDDSAGPSADAIFEFLVAEVAAQRGK